jgi:hypothetical protein
MNARRGQFVKPNRTLGWKLLGAAGGCLLLGACVGNPFEDAKVDPRSPIAGEVAKTVRPDAPYPSFAAIPAVPKDVRPRRQYGQAATQIDTAAAQLERATAPGTWTLERTDSFTAAAQAAAGPQLDAPQPADTEAYAAALRKRATPPPQAKH